MNANIIIKNILGRYFNMNPIFFMPTKVICEKDALKTQGHLIKSLGNTALIVSGSHSSKTNGSLEQLTTVLKSNNIKYFIFDEVEENPSTETINKIKKLHEGNGIDMVIGVGGGSPMDASKAASVLLANAEMDAKNLFTADNFKALPVVAVPTTAGTGSETTQYSILTDHEIENKLAIKTKLFPTLAYLDASFLMNTPKQVTINTGIDALSHLIEGYLSTQGNIFSNALAESGLKLFKECLPFLETETITFEIREKLLAASSIAGMVIAQSGTSLPHGMGYPLTYHHNAPHGMANGLLLKEYLKSYANHDSERVNRILTILEFNHIDEFGTFIKRVATINLNVSKEELKAYAEYMISNEAKLKNHPFKITFEELLNIYEKSFS